MGMGIPAVDIWDYTFGEVLLHIRSHRQQHRRELQERAVLAYHQSHVTGLVFSGSGKPLPPVYEEFPFWTEEETVEMEREKYMNIMMQYAARGGGKRAAAGGQGD